MLATQICSLVIMLLVMKRVCIKNRKLYLIFFETHEAKSQINKYVCLNNNYY